jgi:hypothetical protein
VVPYLHLRQALPAGVCDVWRCGRGWQHRLRQRLALQRSAVEDMEAKRLRLAREAEEEDRFRVAMMEKFANDDKVEQMNAQKRRMKKIEHQREVERLLEERRVRKEFERQQVWTRSGLAVLSSPVYGGLKAGRRLLFVVWLG